LCGRSWGYEKRGPPCSAPQIRLVQEPENIRDALGIIEQTAAAPRSAPIAPAFVSVVYATCRIEALGETLHSASEGVDSIEESTQVILTVRSVLL
jgi:hypothetical protein